jgi:predicted RNA binding protein YcfA (HicA-like mRNA interferase family)
MPKRLGSTEIIRVLFGHGFSFTSQKGSHAKHTSAEGRVAIVPVPKKEIPTGTTRSIIRQSGLTKEDFGL